jgi:hypothetical protein
VERSGLERRGGEWSGVEWSGEEQRGRRSLFIIAHVFQPMQQPCACRLRALLTCRARDRPQPPYFAAPRRQRLYMAAVGSSGGMRNSLRRSTPSSGMLLTLSSSPTAFPGSLPLPLGGSTSKSQSRRLPPLLASICSHAGRVGRREARGRGRRYRARGTGQRYRARGTGQRYRKCAQGSLPWCVGVRRAIDMLLPLDPSLSPNQSPPPTHPPTHPHVPGMGRVSLLAPQRHTGRGAAPTSAAGKSKGDAPPLRP